jgi:ABC-type polysaccharide/polyol phosphate transport system ATPase subunit
MKNWVVNVKNISKRYKLYAHPGHRALEWISLGHTMWHSDFWALKNVSFHVRSGECLGIIGPNGAGKSTLLKIISRSLYPTEGTFEVKGRMVSLLELGTGFNPELTGIQNIFSSARLLGFSEEYVNDRLEGILDFADLGEFIHRPIMTYSSGMYVRLAFSLFACLDPDVYVIDEALSVGDASFQKKCIDRIYEMRKNGVTFLYVSHDLWRVEALCDKVIYLDGGSIKTWDAPSVAIQSYLDDIEKKLDRTKALTSGAMASGTPSQGTADEPKPLTPQFEMYQDSPLRIHRVWVEGAQQTVRTEFYVEEDFFVALE